MPILRLTLILALLLTALPASADVADGVAKTIVLELEPGTRLRGTIVDETDNRLQFDAEGLGLLDIDPEQIVGRYAGDERLKPKPKKVEPIPPGLFGTGLLYGFDKSLAVGISGREADNSEFGINASLNTDYDGLDRRWRFRSQYFFNSNDGEITQDEAAVNLRRDWLLPDVPPFLFAEGRWQYDDFQAWQHRLGAFAGVGYAFVGESSVNERRWFHAENDRLTLLGRVGAGASYEFGRVNETVPEALLSLEFALDFDGDRQRLRALHTLFPSLDNDSTRNVTELSYRIRLDQEDSARGLNLKIGAFNEYLSRTTGDTPHNSLSYFIQLAIDF